MGCPSFFVAYFAGTAIGVVATLTPAPFTAITRMYSVTPFRGRVKLAVVTAERGSRKFTNPVVLRVDHCTV